MNTFHLESAIAAWRRQYETRHLFARRDLDELERHLRDQTEWLIEHGKTEEEAFRQSVRDLGSVFEAETEYRKVFWKKLRFRGQALSELRWRLSMGRQYVHSGIRALSRQKVVSFINLFGLSVALACAIGTYVFLDAYLGMDNFHVKGERIWLVNHEVQREGQLQSWGRTPYALAPMARAGIPGIERAVRALWEGGKIHSGLDVVEAGILFVDRDYLEVMSFPVEAGHPDPLGAAQGVAITEAAAANLFGQEDPLGKSLTVSPGGEEHFDVTVVSVLERLPGASGTRFDLLAPLSMLTATRGLDDDDWSRRMGGTLLLLEPGTDPTAVETGLNAFLPRQREADAEWPVERFYLDNLRDPAPRAWMVYSRLMEAPHPAFVIMLILIPVAMLMLSVFNFVNIAIGSAERRLREIGIRKVVGGQRSQLVAQFLIENLVLCTGALLIAGLLAWAVVLPVFDRIFVYALTWAPISGWPFWSAMLGLLLGTAFISGAYPALYISSFQPVAVFRGNMALPARKMLSHAFLTLQFVVAFLAILIGLYMGFGNGFMTTGDWGYDPHPVVSVSVSTAEQARVMEAALEGKAGIRAVSGTTDHIGFGQLTETIQVDDTEYTIGHLRIGAEYLETMDLPLVRGRSPRTSGSGTRDVVVTPTLVKHLGWSEPMDQTFRIGTQEYVVVGVVTDPVLHPIIRYRPLLFTAADEAVSRLVVAGAGTGGNALLELVEAEWKTNFPDSAFDGTAQETIFDTHNESWTNMTRAVLWMALLALVISCMGLFGLASQGVAARIKEISIRKVLGANPWWVALRVHTRYLILISIGAAIAMPIVYLGITIPVRQFDLEYITVGPGIFIAAYGIVLATALLSIAKHAWTLAGANPAAVLRGE